MTVLDYKKELFVDNDIVQSMKNVLNRINSLSKQNNREEIENLVWLARNILNGEYCELTKEQKTDFYKAVNNRYKKLTEKKLY